MVSGPVLFKALSETTLLLSTQTAGIIEAVTYEKVAEHHACITVKGIADADQGRLIYSTIAEFGKADVNPAQYQNAGKVTSVPQ